MSYVDANLMTGERVVHRTRLHWIVLASPVALFLLGVWLFGTSIANANTSDGAVLGLVVGFMLSVIAVILGVGALVRLRSSEFAVTNRRVVIKTGVIRRNTVELLLSKVEAIGVDQGILGRLFGFGTLLVTGTGGNKASFASIIAPMDFRRHVQEQIEQPRDVATASRTEPAGAL